eukprot:745599-Hanusia_phi.AAC.1
MAVGCHDGLLLRAPARVSHRSAGRSYDDGAGMMCFRVPGFRRLWFLAERMASHSSSKETTEMPG